MATKIEGFRIGDYGFTKFPPNDAPDRATLVIHDEYAEPVYTASEVLPDIDALLKWVHRETVFLRKCGKPQPKAERMVGFMATRYGIKLDPA